MTKNYFLALIAGAALLVAGCNPTINPGPDPSNNPSENPSDNPGTTDDGKVATADLVGTWAKGEDVSYELKEDGSYTEKMYEETTTGKWSFDEKDAMLTFTPKEGEAWKVEVRLIGGKTWMVMVYEYEDGGKHYSYDSFRKKGATVESAPLSDGRWDAPHNGEKPAEYAKDTDYNLCLVVAGDKIDVYVPMWGLHIQGTFTLADGRLHIETDDDHIWAGKYIGANFISWSAWDAPSEDFRDTWDESYGAMNAETFELQKPYQWYSVTEILSRGKDPEKYKDEYDKDPVNFKWMIWEVGVGVRQEALDLCDFDLCVTPDGKQAFGGAVGLTPVFYKR
ncbi:MAG: hypothetical protein IKR15_05435 [Bacteroidales bacterium]|nr:hypothetical protein [Bacteroidales bacterium]